MIELSIIASHNEAEEGIQGTEKPIQYCVVRNRLE